AIAPAAPGGVPATAHVTVTTPAGPSATSVSDTFAWDPVPTLANISPGQGVVGGGGTITINGTGFTQGRLGATSVSFGSVAATNVSVNFTGTQLTATIPSSVNTGAVDVRVTTPGGTTAVIPAGSFNYIIPQPVVTAVSPHQGSVSGGNTVTISGIAFTNATSV